MDSKKKLDKITFKYVKEKINSEVINLKNSGFYEYVFIDAPLLLEAELNKTCDIVIAVISKREKQIERICKRDGITKEEAEKRLKSQAENNFYLENADVIIENLEENKLEDIVQEIWKNKIETILQ